MVALAGRKTGVHWRQLTAHLWVGVISNRVIGSVEGGRRFLAADGAGKVYGRFRELADAQAMLVAVYEQR